MLKTRFAPSPTGYLHLGNVRTALFCALLAKHANGTFLLRIEDTDQLRSGDEFAEQLQYDLRWLGLNWQEGPNAGGENGPYYQSQRQEIYTNYANQLVEHGLAYPCFCSEQELSIARKVQLASGKPPRYLGTCNALTSIQIEEKKQQGLKPTLRFKVPDNQVIEFTDFVKGKQRFQSNEIGDFVIQRADGTAAFFFCNAIDDAMMAVTHVLRGEDHLTNTPRQLMILQALKLSLPNYGHMPLIVGADGSPLSKRHGSRSLKVLHKHGYLPEALINYMARLGHYYVNNALMNFEELAAGFSVANIGSAPARYDESQLLYWQKQVIQQLTAEQFWQWIGDEIRSMVPEHAKHKFISAVQPNVIFPEEAQAWAQVFFADLIYDEATINAFKEVGKLFFVTSVDAVKQVGTDFKGLAQALQEQLHVKGKALFHPLRLTFTGRTDGPEMARVTELLGQDLLIKRLNKVISLVE